MDQIQSVVNALAKKYDFDATEALEFIVASRREGSPAYARAKTAIEKTRAKIDELETKIASRKVRDVTKANAKLEELREKLENQIEKFEAVGKPKPRKPRAVKEKAAPSDDDKKVEKRISKLSNAYAEKLTSLFKEIGSEITETKKKDFVTYINELTEDDYDAIPNLVDHMRTFVEMTTKPTTPPDSDDIRTLTHKILKTRKWLIEGYGPGIYWDVSKKEFVSGPAENTDEDMAETEFNGKKYAVGVKTGRVYRQNDDGDEFVGFAGVNAFKDISQ